ncbi:tetratricopeptide repeat protein [Shewanella sp. WPAGA9]|uniref:tetratricopeptide repeat protein n=2 Tax=Shewanella TaxID=22 RepID=UPI0017871A96|nr:tetratricopeptide repeat protein [Shewanella sp. WPAGA9]
MKFNQLVLFASILITSYCYHSITQAAEFVGTDQCIDCHQTEYKDWQGSHHDMSMRHANAESVLGNFDNTSLTVKGEVYRLFKIDDQYWVNTKGPDGKFNDYQISYTFGYHPLQQYMVEFPDGRLQLIPLAWDARDQNLGGQRWFHLYPDMEPYDEFFWTNNGQNWNYMCADCHSTNISKNYDAEKNQYNTTWSEINVGCEACHGPASDHLYWASQQPNTSNVKAKIKGNSQATHQDDSKTKINEATFGFERTLSPKVGKWIYKKGQKILTPTEVKGSDQLATCGQCHSRRAQISDQNDHINGSFYDKYILNAVTADLYYPDGQIYDEVFVLGSFKQSKMHQAGVVCSDCHNPHSNKLNAPIESICFKCHLPSEYTADTHSQHKSGTDAAQCVTCHMPKTTYMDVDPRADHSFKVPRPDISLKIGTPNVCTSCHTDKDNQWADNAIKQRYPQSNYRQSDSFATVFAQAAVGVPTSGDSLSYIAQNNANPDIIRASALSRLSDYPGQNALVAIMRGVKHEDPQIRLGAIAGVASYPFSDRWQIISPLLDDPVLAVRTETASSLINDWASMTHSQQEKLRPALDEYLAIQSFNADRGFGLMNTANVYLAQGKIQQAEKIYLKAIEIEPIFATSYANLADLYRQTGDDDKSLAILKQGMNNQPKAGLLRYSAGLNLYRQQQLAEAIDYFEQATKVEPRNPQYWYVLGLAQEKIDIKKAMNSIEQAYKVGNNPQHLYALCEFKIKHRDPTTNACINRLSKIVPPQVIKQLTGR